VCVYGNVVENAPCKNSLPHYLPLLKICMKIFHMNILLMHTELLPESITAMRGQET
jgi:hypothetical protein